MNSKRVNELMKMAKSKDADTLGKAYVIAQSIARGELNEGEQKIYPPLIDSICEQAVKCFPPGTGKPYEIFMDWLRICVWIENNRYFTQCQIASFQRDTVLLKGYADKFLLTEKIKAKSKDKDILFEIEYFTLDDYVKQVKTGVNDNEGLMAKERFEYSFAWITAYNLVIELSADIFEIPELNNYKVDISKDIEDLKEVMWSFKSVIHSVENDSTLSEGEQFERVSLIKDFMAFVDGGGLEMKPTNKAIAEVSEIMRNFEGYKEDYLFFTMLFPVIRKVLFNE